MADRILVSLHLAFRILHIGRLMGPRGSHRPILILIEAEHEDDADHAVA